MDVDVAVVAPVYLRESPYDVRHPAEAKFNYDKPVGVHRFVAKIPAGATVHVIVYAETGMGVVRKAGSFEAFAAAESARWLKLALTPFSLAVSTLGWGECRNDALACGFDWADGFPNSTVVRVNPENVDWDDIARLVQIVKEAGGMAFGHPARVNPEMPSVWHESWQHVGQRERELLQAAAWGCYAIAPGLSARLVTEIRKIRQEVETLTHRANVEAHSPLANQRLPTCGFDAWVGLAAIQLELPTSSHPLGGLEENTTSCDMAERERDTQAPLCYSIA